MKTMDQSATAARFLLGGIGTGNISVDQNGRYCDFELFNTPNKGFTGPYTFFAIHTEGGDGEAHTKALESQLQPPFNHSHGFHAWELGGLSRFKSSAMHGEYPFVSLTLRDPDMPVEAELVAFTPFIPLNTDDSSLPGAVLRYRVRNTSAQAQRVSIAGSFANLCNLTGSDIWTKPLFEGVSINRYVEEKGCKGIHFTTESKEERDVDYFEMAFMTTEPNVTYLEYWNEGAWWDGLQDFWNDFTADGELTNGRTLPGKGNRLHKSDIKMSSLCVKKEIPPQGEAIFEFLLTWYRPNRVRSWDQSQPVSAEHPIIRNYYAKFGPPLTTAAYLAAELPRLERESKKFTDSLYGSSYPEYVVDAVASTITVLRSSTCFRVEDGTFFGFEGCFDKAGCCEGNCTHVWNYAQTTAFLFPELERSMRKTEFLVETNNDGRMDFRAHRYLGDAEFDMPPAADGQLGCVIRLYRDWQLCGKDDFLKELWPKAKKTLDYAFDNWDCDGDGMLDGKQHNTYDIEFYGPNSMMNTIFYAALRAGEEISRYLGDVETAERYEKTRVKGSALLDRLTFNGEYYEQKLDDVNEYKYQYGKGCLSDQLFGQQLAHISGLGYVLDETHVKSAVQEIYRNNFLEDFSTHNNLQRAYALNKDTGLLLCTWPHGGRPEIPFVYCDEVWTGIEYQVATHLIYEGFIEQGLRIVKACRDRHDGVERSPWNEVECGHHYARSLASYGLILALSGFHCDAVNKKLIFKPAGGGDFTGFFCCADGWGIYRQKASKDGAAAGMTFSIETLYGDLSAYEVVCLTKG